MTAAACELPVSFAQQRLWFLEQLEDVGSAYTIRLPVRLRGPLDVALLQEAVNRLVARHETLRTTLLARRGEPVQVVAAQLALPVEQVALDGTDEAGLRHRVTELARHAFDLARGPLLRVILVRAAPEDHVLLVLMHHAIADAWSSAVLFRDLAELYSALREGREPSLPELPVQYADYAAWQREWLAGEELQRQCAYWQQALAGAPPVLDLPTDHPRPAVQSFRGSRWTRVLPRELVDGLRRLSGAEGCTLFMTLLAAFDVLLQRYSGQDDLVVGTPVAGRRRTELEPLIGLFAGTLVMRCDLGGQPTFRELLARVKAASLAAWAHQDLPFEKLVEAVQPARSLARPPLFQVMFILQNSPWEAAAMSGLAVSPADIDAADAAKFELTLSATEYGGELWLAFEYNRDLFEAATIERMAAQFEWLLREAVARPGAPIGELALAGAEEQARLLAAWNDTGREVPRDTGVHQLVERRARERPGAVALECGAARWTYGELEDWADALADRLRAQGAGPGSTVALCLERSPEMVGAVLAVLKSGAAYLPLDPAYPAARLDFMLADSVAGWLVTSRRLATRFAAASCRVLCIEDLAPAACAASARPAPAVAADQAAYLIYTSGSTGRPKGVRITHGGVVNFLLSMLEEPGLAAGDRLLAVTTLAFDIAVLELLGPLCAGGTVVIAAPEEARDGAALARRLDAAAITAMQATPATWRALLAAGWQGRAGLRAWCGGEALDAALAADLLARCAGLWNLYGPTETTIWSSCARITDPRDISVGRPVANTRLYVLDAALRPAPPGVPGELCIGGAGVSPGYHARPELTAERFVADPFAAPPGRLYRTGDRARFLGDGRVQLLGRLDAQVKLRGFRIEPGEVEAALAAQPGVAAAAVAVRQAAAGDPRLVAWVVARPGARLSRAGLRQALQRELPDHMVPAAIELADALPLTPNGKVDRRALPAPAFGAAGEGYAAPRNAVEEALCGLFGEILGAAVPVGIHDDFFALGGHSLLATRLVSRIRDVFGAELPLRALFEAPTVAGVAARLDGAPLPAPAAIPRLAAGEAPLSSTQQRLWFLEQLAPGNAAYNLHAAFTLRGRPDGAALARALDAVVARHEALRTVFRAADGEPRQVILPRLSVAVEAAHRPGMSDDALEAELLARAEASFDLARGPLLRAALVSRADDDHVLLLVVHHIVADGWSLAVLFRELAAAYDAFTRREEPALPALPAQFADYARWQRRRLDGGELKAQLDYWRRQLDGAPALINLPLDRPRLPVQRHRGARLARDLPRAVTAGLHALAREADGTFFMVLLSAFATLLARYGGDEELTVGTPIAGRNRSELEGLIGFFVNTLVLRVDLRGNPPFRELLARVRRMALDAYAHAEVPLEQLVEELKPPRDPGRTPLFQVMFNLHNEPAQALSLAGLAVTRRGIGRHTAKFDLAVSAVEHGGGLTVTFEYDTDLFDAATVAALADSYGELLRQVARDAGQQVGAIVLLDEAARAAVAREQQRLRPPAGVEAWPEANLAERFAAQVAAGPRRPAVTWDGGAWTYAELDGRARAIAGRLAALAAAGPVALMLGHDGVMVAGLAGALLAGRAYVPLDTYSPRARNEAILADANAAAVVTDAARLAAHPWLRESGLAVVLAEDCAVAAAALPPVSSDAAAYILYTSGTTGRPKGVLQSHAGVLGQVRTWAHQLQLRDTDRLALFSGYGYDAAVQDVFGALLTGAAVHPLDLRGGASAPELVDRIAAGRLTVLHFTPTVYRYLFGGRVTCEQDLSGVRLVVLGGEQARRSDLDLFRVRFRRGTTFINGLGLTECTMGLQYFADHDTRVLGQWLPVGHPVPGTAALLLDEAGHESAWRGEIGLVSPHLSPGYHGAGRGVAAGAAPTTAPSAIVGAAPAATRRMLRTRDLARRLPDGQLLHTGRADAQVKIRGIRIEPAEIEAALGRHPQVRECAVVAREREPGEWQLVAYVAGLDVPDEPSLRAHLRALLPEYLVPAAFVALPALPRRPNGKLDPQALPAPGAAAAAGAVPPRTEIERRLAELWCGVLKRDRIGVHDDFFALGGHSLLATRLIARVRDAFGLEVPLIALFESPTIAGMATAVERTASRPADPLMPPLARQPRRAGLS